MAFMKMKKSSAQLDREITKALSRSSSQRVHSTRKDQRYYLRIKTAPHQQWMVPAGWSWDDLTNAKAGARKADAQWTAVELIDGETGKKVRF